MFDEDREKWQEEAEDNQQHLHHFDGYLSRTATSVTIP